MRCGESKVRSGLYWQRQILVPCRKVNYVAGVPVQVWKRVAIKRYIIFVQYACFVMDDSISQGRRILV